jgi:MSHA pilin protein MshA
MKRQQGFTLIELIIVIVILGILAVTASPKFLDLTGDARASTMKGLEGSLKGAVNIIYSKSLIDGTASSATASLDDVELVYGYPEASVQNLLDILDAKLENGNQAAGTTNAGIEFEVEVNAASNTLHIYPAGDFSGTVDGDLATGIKACYVSYTEATNATTPPVISLVTTGCS